MGPDGPFLFHAPLCAFVYNAGKGGFEKKQNNMYSDENKSSSLAKLLNGFDFVIMDTCSLMEDGFPLFLDILVNAKDYLREDVRITVYHKCLDELKKHSKNKANDDLRIAAKRALKILKLAKRSKLFEFTKKEKDQNFADNVIYVSVSQMRITKKVLVITQDKGLAEDLGKLNFLDSQRGRKVATYKILSTGVLDVNRGEKIKYPSYRQRQEQRDGGAQGYQAKPAKKDTQNELIAKAKSHDEKLWTILHNPNCPAKRKKDDISAQLSLLGKISDENKKKLTLKYSSAQLLEEMRKADAPVEAKPSESKTNEKPKQVPFKKEEPKPQPKPEVRGFFGSGPSLEAAIVDAARYQGILFRDPSVEYIPQIHGDMDVTSSDLPLLIKAVKEGSKEGVTYKERLFVRPEPAFKGFRVSLALLKPQPKVVEEPKAEEKAPEPEKPKKAEPKKAPKKKAEKLTPQTESVQGTLLVAVPDDEKTKAAIERKARKEAAPAKTKAKAEKPAPKAEPKKEKAAPKKKPEPEKKPEEPKKATPKKASKAKTAEPAEKAEPEKPKKAAPKAKKPAEKKKEPEKKREAKKPQEKPAESSAFEKARKSEARLLSVLSNGNYPKESKLQDLKTQLELVRALKPEEASKLKYNADALKGMIGLMS